jgi:hypothetical protein
MGAKQKVWAIGTADLHCGFDVSRAYVLPSTEDDVESNTRLRPCHSHENMHRPKMCKTAGKLGILGLKKLADVTLRTRCGVTTVLGGLTYMESFGNCRKRKHDLQAAKRSLLHYRMKGNYIGNILQPSK